MTGTLQAVSGRSGRVIVIKDVAGYAGNQSKGIHVDGDSNELINGSADLKIKVNSVGDKTQLSVRPERVSINKNHSNSENSFKGEVKELIYLGDHIRARLEVCGNSEFIVKMPNEGEVEFKEKDIINLSWLPNDIRALDYK